ncbi:MAG: tetratricopeptide repeat protein [Acidobacteriota bacterium]|nr:tetratricopeptide repeat protein [Acidobacteriota bacterium]
MKILSVSQRRLAAGPLAALLLVLPHLDGQTATCKAVGAHAVTPAEKAYGDADFAMAEQLYAQALAAKPNDAVLSAKLVETLLKEGKVAEAETQVKSAAAANPKSAAVLTVQAEVELKQGQPWLAGKSLDAATAADACYARAYLVRGRIDHISSMYASERANLQKAYDIDMTDPDIMTAWSRVMPAANEVKGTVEALKSQTAIDPSIRAKAEATVHSMMPLLHEDTQTCKVLPTQASAEIPLIPTRDDGKHVDGYQVEVTFPSGPANLQVDTAASGLFLSKEVAEANGFKPAADGGPGIVLATSVKIGPLEFKNCLAGVTDEPLPGKAQGFIGTDLLAQYLITFDAREQKLKLDPLPAKEGVLPGDRPSGGAFTGYVPVYHSRQYLLVPVNVDNKTQKLFALDTGMRMSAMDSTTAHAASSTKMNFTNPLQTKGGSQARVYRDPFQLQFADVSTERKTDSIVAFEPAAIEQNTGFDVGGLLGFDVLGPMTLHLDYRDGLAKFDPPPSMDIAENESKRGKHHKEQASEAPECAELSTADMPLGDAIELSLSSSLDSAHLKPGKEIYGKVVHGLEYPGCTLNQGAVLYGKVTVASKGDKNSEAKLGFEFNRGECTNASGSKTVTKPLQLAVIAVLTPKDDRQAHLHDMAPVEIGGAGRRIQDAVNADNGTDIGLNENEKPKTVHAGLVFGEAKFKLDPTGGPSCTALVQDKGSSVRIGSRSEIVLTMTTPGVASGGD